MTTALQTTEDPTAALEAVLMTGDLSKLSGVERLRYYKAVCRSLGLNELTRPFDYLALNGKVILYARRECTDQLAKKHHVNRRIVARDHINGVYVVTAQAQMPDGRIEESIGALTTEGLKGDALANALMKCETKAKRRVTLSICGLGLMDESEAETVPGARVWEEPKDLDRTQLYEPKPPRAIDSPRMTQKQALDAMHEPLPFEDEPVTDEAAERRAFWGWATDQPQFQTPEGKLSKIAVHKALGVDAQNGKLAAWMEFSGIGWPMVRQLLEDAIEAACDAPTGFDENGLPTYTALEPANA